MNGCSWFRKCSSDEGLRSSPKLFGDGARVGAKQKMLGDASLQTTCIYMYAENKVRAQGSGRGSTFNDLVSRKASNLKKISTPWREMLKKSENPRGHRPR
jgi:hypothetical protein